MDKEYIIGHLNKMKAKKKGKGSLKQSKYETILYVVHCISCIVYYIKMNQRWKQNQNSHINLYNSRVIVKK